MRYFEEDLTEKKKIQALAISTFIFYVIVLLWITIFKCNIEASVHGVRIFLEQMTIKERFIYATSYFAWHDGDIKSTVLNVLVFVPFGILMPIIRSKFTPFSTTILAFFSTLAIESLQMILAFGYFTYVDLICNTLGAVLGLIVFKLFVEKLRDKIKNIALTAANLTAIAISIFAIIRTIINIEIYI